MRRVLKVVIVISFVFYLLGLVSLLFLGSRGSVWSDLSLVEYIEKSSNFVPFKTISTYVKAIFDGSMNLDIPIKNLVGNLIMFFPMGIYLPYLVKRINNVGIFSFTTIILLFVIEILQSVSRRGSFDIDDFILNMLGTLIGFGIWKLNFIQKLLKPKYQQQVKSY
ncbi:VanZ family protein [Neobacillus sp. PS3-40]|uniref:VanZ family protein n=1 Tax=Neobacillus sp. PS3-40 TaxID=3070679 RepID=UPI0027DFD99C|nr:VanZ family protein [Neobacillus sp. PS3-40]WML45420.1 VanZ family protein [Neobacillus sp. PS3-40]